MGERDERYVSCPYYLVIKEDHRKRMIIRCEGVSKGNTINLVFADEQKRARHKQAFCYSIKGCRECPIHQMLNRKYGVDDDI